MNDEVKNVWIYGRNGESELVPEDVAKERLESENWADTPAAFEASNGLGNHTHEEDSNEDSSMSDEQLEKQALQEKLDEAEIEYDKRWGVDRLIELAKENGLPI